jgi:hypothetical protein
MVNQANRCPVRHMGADRTLKGNVMALTTVSHFRTQTVPDGPLVQHSVVWEIACWQCGETDIDPATLICSHCNADNNDDPIPDSAFCN